MKPRSRVALLVVALVLVFGVAGATSRARTEQGPLSKAAGAGDIQGVKSLLLSGLEPNTPDGPRQIRPLAVASRQSRLEVMAVLIAAGADPNLADAGGNRWVPLMHAVHKHQTAAVKFLLDHGARPDGPVNLTVTPLMMAVASGQADSAAMLLDRGADAQRRAPDGATLLTLAVSGGAFTDIDEPLFGTCHTDTVKLLRTRVPDLRIDRSLRGRVAMIFARLNGCQEVLTLVKGLG
jgi:ankyrin repeat protein